MFIHLTTHSAYSLQEGLLLPAELVRAAQSCAMPALGLTDHRLLSGTVEFVLSCQKANIQPIIGLEIDLEQGPLSLLAASREGWANLCRISSLLALRESPAEVCTLDEIAVHSKELIAISSFWNSAHPAINQLIDLFHNRLYLALQDPKQILSVSKVSKRYALPVIATHPVYFLRPDQVALQRTLTAIRLNKQLIEMGAEDLPPKGSYFVKPEEMETRFSHYPKAIEATLEIAERCKFDFPLGETHMPTVPLPQGKSAAQVLRNKATAGARKLYGGISSQIQDRLDHELAVIAGMGYEPIFLIVEEILAFARQKGVPISSRGSAASSLVAHCLEITSPDPLYHNLYFERFLNPARFAPPDIDTDLCSRRRDSVIQHVFDTYGIDRVAMVATINRYRPRSALGDVAKAHGLEKELIRKMIKSLPYSFFAQRQSEEMEDQWNSFASLRELYPQKRYQKVFDEAENLLKLPRHLSVHAGGLIVAPGMLSDLVPVMKSGSKDMVITQMDHEAVELLGLVKIDLLGIRGLTVLGDVAEYIQENEKASNSNINTVIDAIPENDAGVSDRVENGKTIGCFQIESPGMRKILRNIKARSEEDIIAALALYRPGPLRGGLKDAFVRRFKGEEEVRHIHPALAPLLGETFGVILYQEQVLRIAHELAGFSLAEADLLRRAMSHFDPGKRMQELQRKFITEAQHRKGITTETGERLWDMIAAFAGYGFPKAHAASYAQIAWRSAWCKTHFPAEFMAAVLANRGGYYRQSAYVSEARRMGLRIQGPNVNYSRNAFSVQISKQENSAGEKSLFMGLEQVSEITRKTVGKILQNQPFASLEDFLSRVDPRPKEAENLARVGAFDDWGSGPAILRRLQSGKWQAGQMSLFSADTSAEKSWSQVELMIAQQELLGISLSVHPLDVMAGKLKDLGAIPISEAYKSVEQRVCVAGLRQSSRRSKTSKAETMMFLSMEDQDATMDVILFPAVYRQGHHLISSMTPFLITGIVEMDMSSQEIFLRAEKVEKLY